MQVRVSTNFGKLAARPLVNAELMREIGTLALSMIRRRTQAGVSVEGAPFRPLSAAYALQKQKALGSSRADLSVSGRMLNEMGILGTTQKTVSLGFSGGSVGSAAAKGGTFIQRSRAVPGGDKAFFHHVSGAGRSRVKRPFFALNAAEVEKIRTAVERHAQRAVKGGR